MATLEHDHQTWDFAEAEGDAVVWLDGALVGADVFPRRWRLFGPLGPEAMRFLPPDFAAEPLIGADVEKLTDIPDELQVGDIRLEGRDVTMSDEPLDLGTLLGGYDGRDGFAAYALGEFEVDRPSQVIFGAGCSYWMQWWIDGQIVLDTMRCGNRRFPISRSDHCFGHQLGPGKHLMVIRCVSGTAGWLLHAGPATPRELALSEAAFSDRWAFVPQTDDCQVFSPWNTSTPSLAVRTDACLTDETISLEYQLDFPTGQVSIVFGAVDHEHYYIAYVPRWGQLHRARAVYAAIGMADGSGHIRNLRMQLMPNIPVAFNAWGSIRVARKGPDIQMWVNDIEGPRVIDHTYGAGRVGMAGFYPFKVRNLKIDGRPAHGPKWPNQRCRRVPWHLPIAQADRGDWHSPAQLIQLSDDELLMAAIIGRREAGGGDRKRLSRGCFFLSCDAGRSWAAHGESVPMEQVPWGLWSVAQRGGIRSVTFEADHDSRPADPDADVEQRFFFSDSQDRGLTWSPRKPATMCGDWHRDIFLPRSWNMMIGHTVLRDGALLAVILHGWKDRNQMIPNFNAAIAWGSELAQPYCTISNDQGQSWSQPVPMDNAVLREGEEARSPCGGFSETTAAQLPSGRIVAVARPFHSPFMWQTHSDDGGKSWRTACYAPFSGHGGPQLVATTSGLMALVARCIGGVGMHVSPDGGANWTQGTLLDYPSGFGGVMIETAPDVVTVIYPDTCDGPGMHLRAQCLAITADGPLPA